MQWRMSTVYLLGAGGHALAVVDAIGPEAIDAVVLVSESDVEHYQSDRAARGGLDLGDGVAVMTEAEVFDRDPTATTLVNGIGQIKPEGSRALVFERFTERGFSFAQVIHPRAIVSPRARFAAGVQVLAGAVVGPDVVVGQNSIVNTSAVVEHSVLVAHDCHIAPGAVVCGDVSIGPHSVVGAGATVIQGCTLGSGVVVGAGAVVVTEVTSGVVVTGVPAVPRVNPQVSP